MHDFQKILNNIDEIALKKEFEFINAKYDEKLSGNKINLYIKIEESEKIYIERINTFHLLIRVTRRI